VTGDVGIETAIDEKAGLVRMTLTGPVGADEFLASFETMLKLPGFRPGVKVLVDMLEHVHQADSEDIRRIAAVFLEHSEELRGTDAAVVVARPVSYGLLRMLQAFVEDAPFGFSVFYSRSEAEKTLGIA
jgi:hypothetical protein